MEKIVHYSHERDGSITRSITRTQARNKALADKVMDELVRKGYRKPGYLEMRKQVEEKLREYKKQLGVKGRVKYPTYAVLGRQTPSIFKGEKRVELPIEKIKEYTTLTIGDSIPVIMRGMSSPMSIDALKKIPKPMLDKLLLEFKKNIREPYIEAQIWLTPQRIEQLLGKKK